jgi:hypothetical protein
VCVCVCVCVSNQVHKLAILSMRIMNIQKTGHCVCVCVLKTTYKSYGKSKKRINIVSQMSLSNLKSGLISV